MVLHVLKPSGEGTAYCDCKCFIWSFIQDQAHHQEPFLIKDGSVLTWVPLVGVKMFYLMVMPCMLVSLKELTGIQKDLNLG